MKGQPYVGRKLEKNSGEKFVVLKLNPSSGLNTETERNSARTALVSQEAWATQLWP